MSMTTPTQPVAFAATSKGKRARIVIIDMLVLAVVYAIEVLGTVHLPWFTLSPKVMRILLWVGSALNLVLAILIIIALFGKASRLVGWFSGVHHVDAVTGDKRGGKTFLKYLLVGLTAAPSAGLAPLIVNLVTYKPEEGQTWYDKVCGLRVVDIKATEKARIVAEQARVRSSVSGTGLPTIVPVEVLGFGSPTPPAPSGGFPGIPAPAQPQPVQPMPTTVPSAPRPVPAGAPSAPPVEAVPGAMGFTPPVAQAWPSASAEGFIDRVPFGPGAGARETNAPQTPQREVVVQPPTPAVVPATGQAAPHSAATASADETLLFISELTEVTTPRMGTTLLLDGELTIPLKGDVILGRNPIVMDTLPDATILMVDDPERGISKTHLAVGPDVNGWWVMDLHSTNGVRIRHTDGTSERLAPDHRHPVRAGSTVVFGRHTLAVQP